MEVFRFCLDFSGIVCRSAKRVANLCPQESPAGCRTRKHVTNNWLDRGQPGAVAAPQSSCSPNEPHRVPGDGGGTSAAPGWPAYGRAAAIQALPFSRSVPSARAHAHPLTKPAKHDARDSSAVSLAAVIKGLSSGKAWEEKDATAPPTGS